MGHRMFNRLLENLEKHKKFDSGKGNYFIYSCFPIINLNWRVYTHINIFMYDDVWWRFKGVHEMEYMMRMEYRSRGGATIELWIHLAEVIGEIFSWTDVKCMKGRNCFSCVGKCILMYIHICIYEYEYVYNCQ